MARTLMTRLLTRRVVAVGATATANDYTPPVVSKSRTSSRSGWRSWNARSVSLIPGASWQGALRWAEMDAKAPWGPRRRPAGTDVAITCTSGHVAGPRAARRAIADASLSGIRVQVTVAAVLVRAWANLQLLRPECVATCTAHGVGYTHAGMRYGCVPAYRPGASPLSSRAHVRRECFAISAIHFLTICH